MRKVLYALFLLLFLARPGFALDPGEEMADPAMEIRARAITRTLRCPVCEGQTVDDSDARLAKDIRRMVRQRLSMGATDAEVYTYIRERYGSEALLDPPPSKRTMPLRLAPVVTLALGLLVALGYAAGQVRAAKKKKKKEGGG